jgi:hypothetical protein
MNGVERSKHERVVSRGPIAVARAEREAVPAPA